MELPGKEYELCETTDIITLRTFLEERPRIWTLMDS